MTGAPTPRCPRCGADLVLEMDPAAPPDGEVCVLLADPPFRFACESPGCASTGPDTLSDK